MKTECAKPVIDSSVLYIAMAMQEPSDLKTSFSIFGPPSAGIDSNLVFGVGGVSTLNAKVKVFDIDVEIRMNQFFLDFRPYDTSHLVAVHPSISTTAFLTLIFFITKMPSSVVFAGIGTQIHKPFGCVFQPKVTQDSSVERIMPESIAIRQRWLGPIVQCG